MKLRYFLISLLLLAAAVYAGNPEFPAYTGFVNDFAGVLDSATKEKLEGLSVSLEQKTSAELAIVTVKSVAPLDSKEYAVKLFEKWKIGKKGKDNGLLVLLAMDERRVEIEVGYGLEGVINDAKAGEILDRYVVPYFKQGKFGDGLYNGAAAIAGRIAETAGQEMDEAYRPKSEAGGEDWSIVIIIVIVILGLFILGFASGAVPGLIGAFLWAVFGFIFAGIVGAVIGAIIGFVLSYAKFPTSKFGGGGWSGGFGGGFGGGGGGGFGGFGGGGSGGGGAGRSW